MCIIGSNVYKNANKDKPKGELSTWSLVITSTSGGLAVVGSRMGDTSFPVRSQVKMKDNHLVMYVKWEE